MAIIVACIGTFSLLLSTLIHRLGFKIANRFNLMDHPNPRRRHRAPTPVVGGIGIWMNWIIAIAAYGYFQPQWMIENVSSFLAIGAGLVILLTVGICDDTMGLGPKPKLIFQMIAAAIVMTYEPTLHTLCLYWKGSLGNMIWPLMMVWIVGITNAINLIDGLDGLAGGTALLVTSSIAVLSFFSDGFSGFQGISMIFLAFSILGFLRFNWNPAKMFLGDNGSLTLGFMIAISSLTCHPPTRSWVMVASIVLMMGYPILDMGLAVWRRYRSGLPLFKADRNHLHFRVQRLGLNARQTAIVLLSISLYLQVTALTLNLLPTRVVVPAIALVFFSVFGLLYIIRCIEIAQVKKLSDTIKIRDGDPVLSKVHSVPSDDQVLTINISLLPIFEVGLHEEKARYQEIVKSLEMMLKSTASKDEELKVSHDQVQIIYSSKNDEQRKTEKEIREKYEIKLDKFCSLMELQCSMSTIPVAVKRIA